MTDISTADWDVVAPSWDQRRDHIDGAKAPINTELLVALDLQAADRVLEVGAGTGTFAAELAAQVASVLATDISPAMVELARATLARCPNAEVAVADGARLDGLGEFDAVVSRMALMFIPDPVDGVRAAHGVLRPGGRLAASVWAGPEHNPWMVTLGMAAVGVGLPVVPPLGPGGPFSLADADRLGASVTEGGFHDVIVNAVDVVFPFTDAAHYIDVASSLNPVLARVVGGATAELRAALLGAVIDATAAYATDDGLRMPGRALVASGIS